MIRHRLLNRRPNESREIISDGRSYHVTIGFDESGSPREVFIRDAKPGSALDTLLDDASVVISIALQHGITPAALAYSMSRVPTAPLAPGGLDRGGDRCPGSVIGAALDLLTEVSA